MISPVLLGAGPCSFALWNACSMKELGYLQFTSQFFKSCKWNLTLSSSVTIAIILFARLYGMVSLMCLGCAL